MADVAALWHAARLHRTAELEREEGAEWFEQRQRFLATAGAVGSREFCTLQRNPPETRELSRGNQCTSSGVLYRACSLLYALTLQAVLSGAINPRRPPCTQRCESIGECARSQR
jgi:hypothetical protein